MDFIYELKPLSIFTESLPPSSLGKILNYALIIFKTVIESIK